MAGGQNLKLTAPQGLNQLEAPLGAYYTALLAVGITNLAQTLTHSLSITAASLIARIQLHQATNTGTVPVAVLTIGTNILTVGAGVSTLMTCDVEVQMIHSIID